MKRIVLATAVVLAFIAAPASQAAIKSDSLVKALLQQAPGLRGEVLRLALSATQKASEEGLLKRRDLLTVIDYSLTSTKPRLFVFNLDKRKLLYSTLVTHGCNICCMVAT